MIIGHVFIFILTPIFANTLEVHKYHASKELYVFLKLTFFQCFNVILNAGAYTWLFRSGVRAWLGDVSALITNVLVCETFVINLGIDLFRPDASSAGCPRAAREDAVRDEPLYEIDADVQIAFRMQLAAKVIIGLLLLVGQPRAAADRLPLLQLGAPGRQVPVPAPPRRRRASSLRSCTRSCAG